MVKNYYGSILKALVWLIIFLIAISVIVFTSGLLVSTNTPAPTEQPSTEISVPALRFCNISESLTVPFTDSYVAVYTQYTYQGNLLIAVSGTGQSAGRQYSDAFYIFADGHNNLITLDSSSGFTLTINGDLAYYLIPNEQIPAYRSDHTYQFEINAPGGRLSFGVSDAYVSDNTGSYEVTLCKP